MAKVNDYDKYASMRQTEIQNGQKYPHRFIEKPVMKKLLPDLEGKKILMLGCGTGEESLLLEENNATDMIGVDLSVESVKLANESYPKHSFVVGDMHKLNFNDEKFDVIYSSLTMHYSATPANVYKEAYRLLKLGGRLLFSVGHPMRWASERIDIDGGSAKILGYTEGDEEPQLYGSYTEFKEYEETFKSGEVLRFCI